MGGGIEIASFRDGGIMKIGNILHTFWRAAPADGQYNLRLIPNFIKYDYFHDALLVQKYAGRISAAQTFQLDTQAIDVVLPPLRSSDEYDFAAIPPPDLSYDHLAVYVFVELPGG